MTGSTVQIKGFVYVKPATEWAPEKVYVLPYGDGDADTWGICVGEIDSLYKAPTAVDVAAELAKKQLATLNKRRDAARAECAKRLSVIDAHIVTLLDKLPATSGVAA